MSWFSGLKNVLFGGVEATKETQRLIGDSIRGVGRWIDEQNLTPEERVKFMLDAGQAHLALISATRDENSARSVTRRYMAWAIVGLNIYSFVIASILLAMGQDLENFIKLAEVFNVGWAFVSVIVFYFGVQFIRKPTDIRVSEQE